MLCTNKPRPLFLICTIQSLSKVSDSPFQTVLKDGILGRMLENHVAVYRQASIIEETKQALASWKRVSFELGVGGVGQDRSAVITENKKKSTIKVFICDYTADIATHIGTMEIVR